MIVPFLLLMSLYDQGVEDFPILFAHEGKPESKPDDKTDDVDVVNQNGTSPDNVLANIGERIPLMATTTNKSILKLADVPSAKQWTNPSSYRDGEKRSTISSLIDPIWDLGKHPNVVKERHKMKGKTLDVKERHKMNGKTLGKSQLGSFLYSMNTDDPSIQEMYLEEMYSLHTDESANEAMYSLNTDDLAIITLGNSIVINQASNKRSFKPSSGILSGDEIHYPYKWYSELVKAAQSCHVYLLFQPLFKLLPKMIVPW